jgi:2-dehydro-3-deoxygluconokinase
MVEFFADEPITTAKTLTKAYGGDTLNLLVAASKLGGKTGYITRVGQDVFGPFLLDSWQKEGIDTSQVREVQGFNGIYFVSVFGDGQRDFTYYRSGSAASQLTPEDVNPDYLAGAKIVHISGITQALSTSSRQAALRAVQLAHKAGIMVSYDPNLRLRLWSVEEARKGLEEVLPYVSIALPSAPNETQQLLGIAGTEEVIRYFWSRGVKIVVVKAASDGCVLGVDGKITSFPAMAPLGIVDTTGAGDAFNGAFLYGISQGGSPEDAAQLGVVVSGLKVGGRGAIASLPSLEEVKKHLPSLL